MKISKSIIVGIIGLAVVSCIPLQKPTTPKAERSPKVAFENEPVFAFVNFLPLKEARMEGALPYLIDTKGDRAEPRCYQEDQEPTIWETKNPAIVTLLEKEEETITKALLDWARSTLRPGNEEAEPTDDWSVAYEIPTIAHMALPKLRLSASQECIDPTNAKLPPGSKTITTLFGAKRLKFSVSEPIPARTVRKFKRTARQKGFHFEPILFEYKKLKDDEGKPLKDKRGRHLYEGPQGQKLIRKKIPRPKLQPAVGWTLTLDDPLYVASGDYPPEKTWTREFAPQECTVNLVFDDVTPRPTDCEELSMVGFGIERTASANEVLVKVATEEATQSKTVPLGQRAMLQVAGRYLVWVESEPIVEGARLSVDSLILAPGPSPSEPPSKFDTPSKSKQKNQKKNRKKRRRKKKA